MRSSDDDITPKRPRVLAFLRSSAVFVLAASLFFALRSLVFGVFESHTILLMAAMFLLPIIALSARRSGGDARRQTAGRRAPEVASATLRNAQVTS